MYQYSCLLIVRLAQLVPTVHALGPSTFTFSSLIYSHDYLRSAAVRSSRSNTSVAGVAMPTRRCSHLVIQPPIRHDRSEVER
ncbi:hypothetical protein V8E53_005461 [Lactarius tabidus]